MLVPRRRKCSRSLPLAYLLLLTYSHSRTHDDRTGRVFPDYLLAYFPDHPDHSHPAGTLFTSHRAHTELFAAAPQPHEENGATMQTLRCPLCCEQFEMSSEAECIAHMETCSAFHAEYGPGARRAGLVSGMEALPPAAAAAPGSSRELPPVTLRAACEGFADALLPLVSLQKTTVGTAEEAVAVVARLAAALFDAVHEIGPDFDADDLLEATFGPLLAPLEAEHASGVRSAVVAALNALQRAAGTDGASARLPSASAEVYRVLCERLLSRMEPSRHCGLPFSLPVCSMWLRGAHQLAHRPNSALARLAAATDGAALFPQWQTATPSMAAGKQNGRETYSSRRQSRV